MAESDLTWGNLAGSVGAAPTFLKEYMDDYAMSVRQVSKESGVAFSTLDRWLRGGNLHTNNLIKLLLWMEENCD